ncbi:MAG TPA: alpha/beta fold hydrolase [Thermomicrobiaceae bacterium]|nr:alpha/beta fold hydrolase [Thermomicrobiaceae bacterium]
MKTSTPRTGYAPVNGLELYYEIHGSGEPLLLIHGGVVGIAMWGPNLPALAATRQVIAVELQGHGRTRDVERPLSYEAMADDVVGLLDHLGLARVDVLGLSLGGGVALQTVIRHPDRVRRLVLVSAAFRRDGWFPEILEAFAEMGPAAAAPLWQSPLAQLYPHVDWDRLFTRIGTLQRTDYDWSAGVAEITAPTLLVFADADSITPAHIVELYGLLGGGRRDAELDGSLRSVNQLAILPGQTHYSMSAAPELVTVVAPFLDAPSR